MQIKYPKENKVIRISNKRPKENSQNNELKSQIDRMKYQIDELETSSNEIRQSSNSNRIEQIENRITANNTAISGLSNILAADEQSISNNSTAIGQTNNTVSQISSDLQTLSNNYTTTNNQVTVHTQQISNMIPQLNGAMYDIAMMSDQVNQNTEDIADLKANGSGGSGGSCNCSSVISGLQSNFDSISNRVAVLESKVDSNSIQYQETIYNEFDVYERELDISKQNSLTTPSVLFTTESVLTSLDENEEVVTHAVKITANIEMKLAFDMADTYKFDVYDNDLIINTKNISIDQNDVNTEKTITIKTTSYTNIVNHNFYIVVTGINAQILNSTIQLNKLKLTIISPNVVILNKIKPFDVYFNYYTNKYYLSDCSNGYAKLAEINANDLNSTSDIVWTQTNIEAQNYKTYFAGETDNTTTTLGRRYAIITHKNNTIEIVDCTDNTLHYVFPEYTYLANNLVARRTYITFYTCKMYRNTATMQYLNVNQNMSVSGVIDLSNSNQIANLVPYLNNGAYLTNSTISVGLMECKTDGIWYFRFSQTYNSSSVSNLEQYISDLKMYAKSYSNSCYNFDTYYKIHEKFYYRHGTMQNTLMSFGQKVEIGEYQDLFAGKNNDYFVVTNNEICYIKN